MDSLTLKRYNFIQNNHIRKATHNFAPRSLIFKLLQEVLKFSDIWLIWNSPKTDLETKFLDLENRSFDYVTFSLATFK